MSRTSFGLAVCVAFALAGRPALAQTPASSPPPARSAVVEVTAPALPPAKAAAVEALLRAAMERHGIPGLSVAVVTDLTLSWSAGLGQADVENDVPARAETVYRLASLSKPITAVAALQLAERGTLDLDAPVQRYVPSFPEKPWPITTRQLLGHVSGIRHYAGDEIDSTRRYASLTDALAIFKDDALAQEPGTKYLYSTYGYTLVGCVIESVSGSRYVDYVHDNVFVPAGMSTARRDDGLDIIKNRARWYQHTPEGLRNAGLTDTSYKIPGGGLCATAPDMAKFAIALLDGTLLKKPTLAEMFHTLKTRNGRPTGYGLGFALDRKKGQLEVLHTGGQQGVSDVLYLLPDQRFAVVILTNLEGVPDRVELARAVADAVLR